VAKFTIITPVFNGEDYIEETVLSVIAATREIDVEYLVVDDGSTDNTRELLAKYSEELRYIYQENSGQAAAINKAIGLAKGVYTTIVNADDPLLTKNLFLESEKVMDREPQVVATYPDWNMIDSKGNIVETVFVKEFDPVELIGKFNCLIGPGGIFRTAAGKNVNGWDPSYRFVPDYDFWLKLSEKGVFRHVPEVQATWRTHETSISISSRSEEMAQERIRVIDQFIFRNPDTPERLKKMAIAHSHYRAAALSYFESKVDGRNLIKVSIRNYPKILVEKDFRVSFFLLLLPASRLIVKKLVRFRYFQRMEADLRRGLNS
jgi:glycosyltransferase involved in cell wall biosynthesis